MYHEARRCCILPFLIDSPFMIAHLRFSGAENGGRWSLQARYCERAHKDTIDWRIVSINWQSDDLMPGLTRNVTFFRQLVFNGRAEEWPRRSSRTPCLSCARLADLLRFATAINEIQQRGYILLVRPRWYEQKWFMVALVNDIIHSSFHTFNLAGNAILCFSLRAFRLILW